jgi:hypothetical protein
MSPEELEEYYHATKLGVTLGILALLLIVITLSFVL